MNLNDDYVNKKIELELCDIYLFVNTPMILILLFVLITLCYCSDYSAHEK